MDIAAEQKIAAPRERVYEALNDPEILRQCIPGCESLEKVSDTEMNATVTLRVGPVKARFKGSVTLQDLDPPAGYVIVGEGKGGPAGFAKGRAEVKLAEDGQGTILSYAVKVDLGGKMAQIGGRLMEGTTRKLSGQFFEKFSELVSDGEAAVQAAGPSPTAVDTKTKDASGFRLIAIVGIVAVVAILFATLT